MKRSQHADSNGTRFGGLSRHWDLLAAIGIMLLAATLAWILRAMFAAPPEPRAARPPATAVSTAERQHAAAGETTATPAERIGGLFSTPTGTPHVAAEPTAIGVELLVERWLARYCRRIENHYEEQGRERWRCSWRDVHISGSLPSVEVEFTRVDRAVEGGRGGAMELLAREHFYLICVDGECRERASVPRKRRTVAARQAGTAPPRKELPSGASPPPRNHPPVVEILAAPQRVVPGERVVLESRVTDPDSVRGDEVECAWSVDGRPVTRLCWQLVWTVPATKTYGNVIFTLRARDRQGASDSKSVSVFVGPGD